MPYRKMTAQETKDWLGNGLVMPGRKPPGSSGPSSMRPSRPTQPQQTLPPLEVDLDQAKHDERMARMTQEERRAMIKGLGDLARSKIGPI
jgi:hypothetical protein